MEKDIPKKIYYVWLGHNKFPKIVQKNLENWKKVNPEFKIIRIDESNYDISKYKYVKDAYADKNWAFASDLVRLDVIYNNGGFYFDTDVYFRKNINFLRKYQSVWAMENSGLINSGLIIGAHKGDRDLRNIINIYKEKTYDRNNLDNLITVGIISNYFKSQGLKINNKIQYLDNNRIIFPSEYFAPYHWCGGGKVTANTVAVQEYLNSWETDTNVSLKDKLLFNLRLKFPQLYIGLRKLKKHMRE